APDDPSCITDETCLELDTDNTITRTNALYTLTFTMPKNFRWVALADGWALVARDWVSHPFPFDGGNGALNQAYTLDVFFGRPEGTPVRYQALWSDTDLPVATSGDLQRLVVTGAVEDAMKAADRTIKMQFHP